MPGVTVMAFLKARGWSGHISPLAPALGLQLKKMAMSPMSPSSPVHGGQTNNYRSRKQTGFFHTLVGFFSRGRNKTYPAPSMSYWLIFERNLVGLADFPTRIPTDGQLT